MEYKQKKIKVIFFQRKQRELGNFSVEIYFDQVRKHLSNDFMPILRTVPFESNGLIRRILNIFYCFLCQGDINHITGDIHYVSLLLKKKKTILTILDCGILHSTTGYKRKIIKLFWFTLPIIKCKVITCISEATKNDLLNLLNCDFKKIEVVYVSISPNFIKKIKYFNSNYPQILQIGTAENKNLKRLIPALKGIKCKLVIVGKIDQFIENLIKEFNIDCLNISIKLPEEKLIEIYYNSDIVTLVSTLEGFGMPSIEANSIGRVVLAGSNSSMVEVSNNSACLVDSYNISEIRNGLLKIINDHNYRFNLIENGFLNAKRFSIQKIAVQYSNIYKSLLN
jgi:glycosyltransferase involved in cell wall biosynthesis